LCFQSVHTYLMETYGLPIWGSYIIFALFTIVLGALLGLVIKHLNSTLLKLIYPNFRYSCASLTAFTHPGLSAELLMRKEKWNRYILQAVI